MDKENELPQADEAQLKRAKDVKRIAWILSISGLVLVTLGGIFQQAWLLFGILELLYLPAMVLVYWGYGGLMRFTPLRTERQPLTMLFSIVSLQAFWQLNSSHVVTFLPLFPYMLVGTILMTLFFYADPRRIWQQERGGILFTLSVLIGAFLYSFSAVLYIDHFTTKATPSHIYPTQVVRKYIIEGKVVNYHVRVAHWDWKVNNDLKVDGDIFNSLSVGDSVHVFEYNGGLGSHWYELNK